MFNLIRYGICHPKFLGKYMVEKTYKIILTLLAMFLIVALTCFGLNVSNTYLTDAEATEVKMAIINETDISYSNNKLLFNKETQFELFNFIIILDKDGVVENNNLSNAAIVLTNDRVDVRMGDMLIRSKNYSDFSDCSFSFSKNDSINISDNIQFFSFIEQAFSLAYPTIYITLTMLQVGELLFSGALLFLFIFLLTGRLNTQVKGVMRIRLLLSCFISYLFLYWFYYVLDQNILIYFLTFVIPYIYFIVALGNILRISKVVKE